MIKITRHIAIVLFGVTAASAQQGSLDFGAITRHGSTLQIPVMLAGDLGDGVSTMDFRFRYDPGVLEPISVDVGTAASAAGKVVLTNEVRPGEYSVLMWGEQQTVAPGQVALVRMRVLDDPADGQTSLTLANITLARPDATSIPSRSATQVIPITSRRPEEPTPPEEPPTEPTPEEPTLSPLPGGVPSPPSGGGQLETAGVLEDVGEVPPGEGLTTYKQLADRLREASRLRGDLPTGGLQPSDYDDNFEATAEGEPIASSAAGAADGATENLAPSGTSPIAPGFEAGKTQGVPQSKSGGHSSRGSAVDASRPSGMAIWSRWALIAGGGVITFAAVWFVGRRFLRA